MDLLAITAHLSIANGTVLNEGAVPGLVARPAPPKAARGRERDFLFAHLTLAGPADETAELAGELIEGLGRRFFAAPGSVTSALRRAVIDTNDQLLRRNLAAKATREGALSCAVLHGNELFTLQVGEGLAFLGHNFGIERLPARPPQHLTPLGRSAGIDIRFAYHQLQNGDMMLFCDPRLAHLSGESLSGVLVDTEIESGLDELLGIVAGDTARLMLVEFADELPSTLPLTFQHSRQPAPKPGPPPKPAAPKKETVTPAVAQITAVGHAAADAPGAPPVGAPAANDGTATLEIGARRVASTSARGLSRFTAWLAAAIGRLSERSTDEPSVHWAIPAAIALIVPIVIAAVVTSVYVQRDTVAEVARIKQQMMDEMLAAENVGGSAEAQPHYLTVVALAAEAEELRADDLEVAGMRADALDALDRLDGVTRLTAAVLYEYEDGADLARIALRGGAGGIAVLDRLANRVMFHATDDTYRTLTGESPAAIGFGGQAVGAQTMGELFDVIWLPGSASETRDSFAMLDRAGSLFNYFPNLGDVGGVALPNSSGWDSPTAMATYLDRLYVLDAGAGQIWKYYISSGYTQFAGDEAIFFSENAGLDGAVDFDLYAEDGSLVVLYGDGRIRYYDTRSGRVRWDETTLAQGGLATPLVAPVAVKMVGSGLNASIFVLDPGSGRLLQLGRGGTVLTQYRVMDESGDEVLTQATDFAVTESPLGVLVVAGDRIYLAENN